MKWNSVKTSLPPRDTDFPKGNELCEKMAETFSQPCLIAAKEGKSYTFYYGYYNYDEESFGCYKIEFNSGIKGVTHWMVPDKPKGN